MTTDEPAEAQQSGGLAMPVFIAIDRENGAHIREELLWKVRDVAYDPRVAAQKLCSETAGLGTGAEEHVEQQIRAALLLYPLSYYGVAQNGGLALLEVEVQLRDQVFRDEVEWDLSDPQNTAFSYANAVCCDLGLGWDFAAAITGAIEAQLTAKRQVELQRVESGSGPRDAVVMAVADRTLNRDLGRRLGPRVQVLKDDVVKMEQ